MVIHSPLAYVSRKVSRYRYCELNNIYIYSLMLAEIYSHPTVEPLQ